MGDMKELEKLIAKERREWRECQADAKIGKIVKDALGKLTGQIEDNLRAEMLDDPEKFLGKAEPEEPEYYAYDMYPKAYINNGGLKTCDDFPEMQYAIKAKQSGATILVCRDEATRDRVLAFLNGKGCGGA